MTIRAKKFTPEVMLRAPRRSAGVPNGDASLILYTVSTYSFEEHSKTSQVRILKAKDNSSHLVTMAEGASQPQWIDDKVILLLPGEHGATKIAVGDPFDFDSHYVAGTVDAPISDLKLVKLDKGKYAIALTAAATPDGELYNPEHAKKPNTTGRLYKSTFVRHWDKWISKERNSIWYGTLVEMAGDTPKQYLLSPLTNALKDTGLESPIPPFGGADHFDLSINGIIFTAKDPQLSAATNTKTNIYYIPIPFSKELTPPGPPPPIEALTYGFEGASTSLVFSPDGKQAAFLRMRENGYEADKNQLFLIPDLEKPSWVITAFPESTGRGAWASSPGSITWSKDSKTIFLTAEFRGQTCLYSVDREQIPTSDTSVIKKYHTTGNVSAIRYLENDHILISGSSMVDNSIYSIVDAKKPNSMAVISSLSKNGAAFGLSPDQITEFWTTGADKTTSVHSLVIRPSNFDEKKKYPLAFLIHGGPQGAWQNAWNTRWNPAVFAEQGYVVVMPNPTGSTGYGQDFCDAIQDQWGGLPYQDLVNCMWWIENNVDYIDSKNAVALGASYGGFMINWIQGNPLGRKFKALVCHDGVFSMTGQLASEETWFPFHDMKGPLWKNPQSWSQWDPSRLCANWATPQLVIHSELDYRLTVSEGLSAFTVLQAKGIESEFLTFPDENHWVLKPENGLLWHTVVLDFVNPKVGLPKYSDVSRAGRERREEAAMDGFGGDDDGAQVGVEGLSL
ncbi:alpha/beta-hydrolase [Pseudovirgaria hyperparasitica]|uniref:Dipeptidyl-peptidase V n=1 Tax=Pseudovirgaria hyperparasitica TaxID=470096 RepID=A0A6A6W491_9PEZI|nr:alpha/beta-hydrolase [Pseudovirgaria hyperparasitica]KAF2756786.1 alpha/beta-hydrolase [Pseudovirgaria hyperparasitica]